MNESLLKMNPQWLEQLAEKSVRKSVREPKGPMDHSTDGEAAVSVASLKDEGREFLLMLH